MNSSGATIFITAAALVVVGLWGGVELYKGAKASEKRAELAAFEVNTTTAEVVRIQRRGGGNDRRSIVHYRYVAGGRQHTGATAVRRQDRDRYVVGWEVPVTYLASEPDASWMDGYTPGRRPIWPAVAVLIGCIAGALVLGLLIRRQSHLLTYGRPAVAVVTKVEKRRTDKGSVWRVHYEWTLLSGGKRKGRYNDGEKVPPKLGMPIPIVYDRDQPSRHSKYPLSLVAPSGK